MKSFFMNIAYTIKAFVNVVLTDIYLRIELAAAIFIAFFAYAYKLDRTGFALIVIACAAAIAMQLIYNALKNSENRFMAASASAVTALGALITCLLLLTEKEAFKMALLNIIYSPRARLCGGGLFVICVLFVAWFERKEKRHEK